MASATRGLVVKISTPNVDVNGLENLKVITTVTNTGDETLKLLNDPHGVLYAFPANTFTITFPAGPNPEFIGAMLKYGPEVAARHGDPRDFTILAPGVSTDVTHDLAAAYDFSQSGPGEYFIEPSNEFYYIDADCTPHKFYATVEDPVKVRLSGDLSLSHFYDTLNNLR